MYLYAHTHMYVYINVCVCIATRVIALHLCSDYSCGPCVKPCLCTGILFHAVLITSQHMLAQLLQDDEVIRRYYSTVRRKDKRPTHNEWLTDLFELDPHERVIDGAAWCLSCCVVKGRGC